MNSVPVQPASGRLIRVLQAAWRAVPEAAPAKKVMRSAASRAIARWRAALDRIEPRPVPAPPASDPVIVAGVFGSVLGLGEGARSFADALERTGRTVVRWDLCDAFLLPRNLDAANATTEPPGAGAGTLVFHLNPPEMLQVRRVFGPAPFRGRRVIGFWHWELQRLPQDWLPAFDLVDEAWAPTRYVADAIEKDAPERVVVRVLTHPMRSESTQADRGRFGLPEDRVAVLTAFDLRSTLARKNPFAVIEAFKRARTLTGAPALLVCKVMAADQAGAAWTEFQAMVAGREDVRVMAETLSEPDMDALIASADVVASLHRAEGFGLSLSRAMVARKAVLATGWSGNVDFMDADSAALVDYALVPVHDPAGRYVGGVWAEPDVDDAARKLAALLDDPEARRALGERARAYVLERTSYEAWAEKALAALGGAPAKAEAA